MVADEMRAEAIRRAGTDEGRETIVRRLLLEDFDWDKLRFSVYRSDTTHKQKILRGTHEDFPDLTDLYAQDKALLCILNNYMIMMGRGREWKLRPSAVEHMAFVKAQTEIEIKRKELKAQIKARTIEILGPDAYAAKRRPSAKPWENDSPGWLQVSSARVEWAKDKPLRLVRQGLPDLVYLPNDDPWRKAIASQYDYFADHPFRDAAHDPNDS